VLGQNQPGPATKPTGRGIIPPLPSSCCRTCSACRRNLSRQRSKSGGERRVTWRGGGSALLVWMLRWQCCGGGRWGCRGSRMAAPSAAVLLFQAAKRLLLFPSPLMFRFFSLLSFTTGLSLCPLGFFFLNSFGFKLPCVLFFLSLCFVSSLSILSLLSPFRFLFFLPPPSLCWCREQYL